MKDVQVCRFWMHGEEKTRAWLEGKEIPPNRRAPRRVQIETLLGNKGMNRGE